MSLFFILFLGCNVSDPNHALHFHRLGNTSIWNLLWTRKNMDKKDGICFFWRQADLNDKVQPEERDSPLPCASLILLPTHYSELHDQDKWQHHSRMSCLLSRQRMTQPGRNEESSATWWGRINGSGANAQDFAKSRSTQPQEQPGCRRTSVGSRTAGKLEIF